MQSSGEAQVGHASAFCIDITNVVIIVVIFFMLLLLIWLPQKAVLADWKEDSSG